MHHVAPLILLTLTTVAFAPAQEQEPASKPPSGREERALLTDLLGMDPVSVEDQAKIRARLSPYDQLPSPTGSKRKKLLGAIEKAWRSGDKLPKKAGEYWYWDDPQKGRYFVAGKVKKPKGLFIGLHGGGVGSADASGAHGAFKNEAAERDWVALFPQAIEATERGWVDAGTEEWIVRLIEEARRTYSVPADKVFIGGHSMGGFGAWTLGAHHADLFAAALPAAGAPSPIYNRDGSIYGIETGVIPNLRNLPMCVFQSTDDPRVPVVITGAGSPARLTSVFQGAVPASSRCGRTPAHLGRISSGGAVRNRQWARAPWISFRRIPGSRPSAEPETTSHASPRELVVSAPFAYAAQDDHCADSPAED
ncbi:alpha/beta hydrolase-fold protein [Planctomycetota bacterium]|nr:alpha/beta hydrolase-fold protein [Planctomycetota bacterium]